MAAYSYTYKGTEFRVQLSKCTMSAKNVSVFFLKLNMATFEVSELGFEMTDTQRQDFFSSQVAGALGNEILTSLIDWAATNAKDLIVLDGQEPTQDYVSPTWSKV